MENLKEVFGDGALSFEEFNKKVSESGYKLADLSKGDYVSAINFKNTLKELNELKNKYDTDTKEYAKIKEELETIKSQNEFNTKLDEVLKANVDDKFGKFITKEVMGLVTKEKDFKTVLAEYVKENPQYLKQVEQPKKGLFKKGVVPNLEGGNPANQVTTNQAMNEIIRGIKNKN